MKFNTMESILDWENYIITLPTPCPKQFGQSLNINENLMQVPRNFVIFYNYNGGF